MLPGGVAPLEPFELDGFEALTVSTGNEPKPARIPFINANQHNPNT